MFNLKLDQFFCEREGHPLFNPVTVSIEPGDIIHIAGPNGAGKTTLLRALCGLFDEWSGNLYWQGRSMRAPDYDVRAQLLYLGHAPGVTKALSAAENLRWAFGVRGECTDFSISEALDKVGLAGYENIPCHQMSAGQLRRVALARLYVTTTKVWLLDEPFTAIDKKGVAQLETLLHTHVSNGGMVLMTTHQSLSQQNIRTLELEPYARA